MRDLTKLVYPFPQKVVHTNPSGGGSYVAHHVVEQRLLDVLGVPPETEVAEVIRGWVAPISPNPQGSSKRQKEGRPELKDAVVGVLLIMSVRLNGENVSVVEAGDCEDPHNWSTDGQRLKDAMSDAYKRCAMRLGVGLHLWSGDDFYLFEKLSKQDADAQNVDRDTGELVPS
jgi:hypothetical protein